MNMLIDNLTGVTSTSAGQHRLNGRPVGAHDELDHHGIAGASGHLLFVLTLVIPSSGL